MSRTIIRLFDTRSQAETAVRELGELGVPIEEVTIAAYNVPEVAGERRSFADEDDQGGEDRTETTSSRKGAGAGAMVGGAGGLLAGLGLIAVPGVGPVVAGGWLVSTLVGAAVGGAAGGVMGLFREAQAGRGPELSYARTVREGGALVSVRADEGVAPHVEHSLNSALGVDAASRRTLYAEPRQARSRVTTARPRAGSRANAAPENFRPQNAGPNNSIHARQL